MTESGADDHWFAVLSEVRRQVKHVADASGVESAVEGDGRLYDEPPTPWQVVEPFEKIQEEGVWQEQQWQNAFEILFLGTPARLKGGSEQDDLLFFVLKDRPKAGSPLLVRRKGKAMPADLTPGAVLSETIAWVDSVMLNLVLQTAFLLRACICRKDDLPNATFAPDTELPPGVVRVSGNVFASPSRVKVLDARRLPGSEAMEVAYPDICFAVDESHAGFDRLVLPEPGMLLMVTLTGEQGIALHAESEAGRSQQPSGLTSQKSPHMTAAAVSGSGKGDPPEPVSLLSGYVSFDQLEDLMRQNRATLKRGEGLRITMRGPGGQGFASVSSKWIRNDDGGHLLVSEPSRNHSRPGILNRLLPFSSRRGQPPQETNSRICCSMTEVTLPVALLAPMLLRVPLKMTADD